MADIENVENRIRMAREQQKEWRRRERLLMQRMKNLEADQIKDKKQKEVHHE